MLAPNVKLAVDAAQQSGAFSAILYTAQEVINSEQWFERDLFSAVRH